MSIYANLRAQILPIARLDLVDLARDSFIQRALEQCLHGSTTTIGMKREGLGYTMTKYHTGHVLSIDLSCKVVGAWFIQVLEMDD